MKMRIVALSIQTADAAVLQAPARRLSEVGVDADLYAVNADDVNDDVLVYQELVRRTKEADFVFVRCMSDTVRCTRFERYEEVLKSCKALVFLHSGNFEVTMLKRDLFRGTDREFMDIRRYSVNRSPENDYGLLRWAAHQLGLTETEPPAPLEVRSDGIYHAGFDRDVKAEDYYSSLDPAKPTAGVLFTANLWQYENLAGIDALVKGLEDQGLNTIPVFYSGVSYSIEGQQGTRIIIERYFTDHGRPRIDVLVACTSFSVLSNSRTTYGVGTTDEENCYHSLLNVPVLYAMGVSGEYSDYESDKIGLKKKDFTNNVFFPEIDGDVITVPYVYTPMKAGTKKAVPIPDRIESLANTARMWASFRRTPVRDRKVAILLYQHRADYGCIGNAAGLDGLESVADLLKRLSEEGYSVEDVPADGRALVGEILANVTNDLESLSSSEVKAKAAALVSEKTYLAQYTRIPGWDREMTERSWGKAPGTMMVEGREIIIPGLVKGNVFIGFQPLRGMAENFEQNIHDPELFAQHQYIAYYRWIQETFGADMVVHVGTHGTVEWLPGKNVGMSAKCNPDNVLRGIPNIYPYIIDDPGEGIQCKRRAESVLIGHMPPTMARADRYDELAEVQVPLQDYFRERHTAKPDRLAVLVTQIYEAAKEHDLLNDLNITPENDPGPEGFEPYVTELHEYLSDVEDALVRSDLHVLGRAPEGRHLEEAVYSLTRQDNGDVRSLRDAFAEFRGVDMDYALEHPSEEVNGELLSVTAAGVDSELRDLIHGWCESDFDKNRCLALCESRFGKPTGDFEVSMNYVLDTLVPNLRRMTDEIANIVRGFNGEYVLPGPSGAPTRGNADILPMGRNFYSMDPDTIPNRSAWEIGRRMADQMIERYVSEKGDYPREIGFIVWATDTMKTGGDDIAYILWLMGVRPTWSKTGGQVTGLEVVPLEELGRPRLDVTVNITGLFRDTFPNLIDMIDDAVKMVSALDEDDQDNALAANLRRDIVEGIASGLTPDDARRRNSVRIFGAAPGTYGTGVNKAIETSTWETVNDLADIYIGWCSSGYSRDGFGVSMKKEFVKRFSQVGVTVKNLPDREIDFLDCDDFYSYLGGMNAFVRTYGRKDAMSVMGDGSDPKKTKLRTAQEELRYLFRSKVLNPKFIEGLKEHGYRGAAEMANLTEFTMAWGATSDVTEDWMYEGLADRFLLDKDTMEWLKDVNPYAAVNIVNRLEESVKRGLWNASQEYLDKLAEIYLDLEERVEELSDR